MRTAFITGITGQDGAWLAKLLLEKKYRVIGLMRRQSLPNPARLKELDIFDKIEIVQGDLTDAPLLTRYMKQFNPDEIYNLAAQSFVQTSWDQPLSMFRTNTMGTITMLEAMRDEAPDAKFYQASSSEMIGTAIKGAQSEKTPLIPRNPYGVSKLASHHMTGTYRTAFNLFACSGILFNHESELRGPEFVSRKITLGVANALKSGQKIQLGNLNAQRDWGYAPDYVYAMWLMLQQKEPDDYVIATGIPHSVQQFAELAFAVADLDWKDYVSVDQSLLRPHDYDILMGEPQKAKTQLGWKPSTTFEQMLKIMVEHDIKRVGVT